MILLVQAYTRTNFMPSLPVIYNVYFYIYKKYTQTKRLENSENKDGKTNFKVDKLQIPRLKLERKKIQYGTNTLP